MLCNDCKGIEIPDYVDEKVIIECIGYCKKCGCGIYEIERCEK